MANDCIPFYEPGLHPDGYATAAITGKRFLQLTGDLHGARNIADQVDGVTPTDNGYRVGHPNAAGALGGAGAPVVGVAGYDTPIGGAVKIIRGGIVPVTAGEALAAGDLVTSAADGQAVKVATVGGGAVAVGQCMTAAASGADAEIMLFV